MSQIHEAVSAISTQIVTYYRMSLLVMMIVAGSTKALEKVVL